MFSMSATAPNSARKNQRQRRATSPSGGSVGSGELNIINNGSSGSDSFISPSKGDNHLARSQNNISPITLNQIGERNFTQTNQASQSQKSNKSRGSCSDISIDPDDRDEKSSLSLDTKSNTEQKSINNNDAPYYPNPTKTIIKRNDSISANIDDMDVSTQSNKNSVRLRISPKQERCSLEMKKNILSLLEKDAKHRKRQVNHNSTGKKSERDEQLHPSYDRDKYTETILIDNGSYGHNFVGSGRKRLETEESRASTLSTNDLLNLQRGCALSSTSSFTADDKSNDDEHHNMKEMSVNREELIRTGSMEPMVEETPANTKPPALPPSPLQAERQQNPSSPLIYRLHNNLPKSPMSAVNSTYMELAPTAKASLGSPCSSSGIAPSLFQDNADDDIGGDTYFEEQFSPRQKSVSTPIEDEKVVGGSLVNEVGIDDLMTPIPPPRVNRTKNNPIECSSISPTDSIPNTTTTKSNTKTSNIADLAGAPLLPLSPRRQTLHTHSLLDDCSDDEDNYDDDDEKTSSSYVIIDDQSSSRGDSSWKKRSSVQSKNLNNISISQQLASNNIQIALLQTRHRRWEIQSTLCGPHAQSNQVFDLSTRVHHIPKFHNRQQQHFSFSPIRTSMFSDADIGDDDDVAFIARLSVSIEAIRAAALGSGLWRTVRLVKLPQGLFGWHWIMWKEQRQVPDSVYFGDELPLDNEVWSLLQMLGDTFPNLEQVDFGGDIAKSTSSTDERSIDSADTYNREDWRNEILTCVMQCLPKLIAVDGFAVEIERGGVNDDPINSNETQESSLDGSFGDVPLNANGEQAMTENDVNAQNGVRTRKVRCRTSSFNVPNQCDVATETSDAMEDVSENIMSLCGNYVEADGHSEENNISPVIVEPNAVDHDEKVTHSANSPLASSFSWGSNGSSSNRPPTCPKSDRRRLPTKPTMKSQTKSKLSKKNKRRLKKLTGLMPSMMDDEEDSDDEEMIVGEGMDECPTDLL